MSEIKKPVITKEQAEAFEKLREQYTDEEIVIKYIESELDLFDSGCACLYDLGFTDFLAALINGYEVEKTPEEKVREYYESYGGSPSAMERKEAVQDTLDLLGIKIEGVNA
ncbi:hypothetical protein OZL92_17440 [Bacillus sonorensis]|mgnify:CR=1 FL=1|uniref:Uncharacterized protein n=1 Tax=Bacillus sonorensis L12 TaxID=1274524 RepID=M5PBP6_9BACI|nr:hypothetical protein [Bacillus sonorensis]EME72202.1 hypothetical protein BSONL12_22930 [Bacillus sonorensis L12]MCZ0075472.1 hypothetical protein [Bacillus sonorensis]MCZ0093126.1 hypothetical protein [Bacillus sonorensis]PAD58027.1 hypothetical protein CHH92_22570 [Bacillus sonorensis]